MARELATACHLDGSSVEELRVLRATYDLLGNVFALTDPRRRDDSDGTMRFAFTYR